VIQLPERSLGYFLVQCADEERSELLNVGVVVYDPDRLDVRCRVATTFGRIERTLPNVPITHLRSALEHAEESARAILERSGIDGLAALADNARGTIRFSPLRSILSRHIDETARELLERLVEPADTRPRPAAASSDAEGEVGGPLWSRRVINSVEKRLQRMDLTLGRDYARGVTIHAKTENDLPLPVWFPLRVGKETFVDGIDIKPDINRTLDSTRAIAQKATEAYRAKPEATVSIIVRDPAAGETGDIVEDLLKEAGDNTSDSLLVTRYSYPEQLDELLQGALRLSL
jgi:hypothetical protein